MLRVFLIVVCGVLVAIVAALAGMIVFGFVGGSHHGGGDYARAIEAIRGA